MSKVITFRGATTGISEYSIPAIDVAVVGDMAYFVTATWLLSLGGALGNTDDPYVLTGQLQPLGGQEYNAPKMTLGIKGTGTATVQTTTNESGVEQVNAEIAVPLKTTVDQYEVVLGTANVARTYQVKVGLPGGARLLSSDLYINPVRHRRG